MAKYEDVEAKALKDEMMRRIDALEELEDYRELSMFEVEQANDKTWKRLIKQYGWPTRVEAPDIDWVDVFWTEFKRDLARQLVLPVVRQLLVEHGQPPLPGDTPMPSKTPKQARTMRAAAHNPKFAKKLGIPVKVAKDFVQADIGRKPGSKRKS